MNIFKKIMNQIFCNLLVEIILCIRSIMEEKKNNPHSSMKKS